MRTSMPSNKSVFFLLASVAMEETEITYSRKIYQWKFCKEKKELTHFLGHYHLFISSKCVYLCQYKSKKLLKSLCYNATGLSI